MTTDLELAEEIERMRREAGGRNQFALWLLTNVDEIIAALRRGPERHERFDCIRYPRCATWCGGSDCPAPERPPSGVVMVPMEPTRETILAINAAYWRLEEQTEIIGQGRASVDEHARTLYRAMLSAAEAEGRKG